MLGISQSAVSTRINKARKRLKELLEGEVSSENED
jgi:DNA-directed RNA polymerase specialized sigma24 family protein